MNDQAGEALGQVIRTYGPSICNTPRSCEMFIRQACGGYPDESKALIEALRQGVTQDLADYRPADRPWEEFTDKLRTRLKAKAGLSEVEGTWAVETWARALGRHPENWEAAPMAEPVMMDTARPASERSVKVVMTLIVTMGGAIGGAVGTVLVPGTFLLTSAYAKIPLMSQPVRHGAPMSVWTTVILILLVLGSIGAVGGAIGAALGWLYGKGDRGHWTAFSTACGGAFASSALGSYFCGIPGSCFGSFLGAFGAATTSARRGGYA